MTTEARHDTWGHQTWSHLARHKTIQLVSTGDWSHQWLAEEQTAASSSSLLQRAGRITVTNERTGCMFWPIRITGEAARNHRTLAKLSSSYHLVYSQWIPATGDPGGNTQEQWSFTGSASEQNRWVSRWRWNSTQTLRRCPMLSIKIVLNAPCILVITVLLLHNAARFMLQQIVFSDGALSGNECVVWDGHDCLMGPWRGESWR